MEVPELRQAHAHQLMARGGVCPPEGRGPRFLLLSAVCEGSQEHAWWLARTERLADLFMKRGACWDTWIGGPSGRGEGASMDGHWGVGAAGLSLILSLLDRVRADALLDRGFSGPHGDWAEASFLAAAPLSLPFSPVSPGNPNTDPLAC
mmetsp:Transcript_20082/g.47829  ORF Transcript_20082/g.47829 Transcript_20082/m.47829 type:complete len:149 (+) Transcript_20082:1011-1457(+)